MPWSPTAPVWGWASSRPIAPRFFSLNSSAGIVGATHAGWRGAVAGVLEATISAMITLGSARERITAAVGPCIAQASYEVGPDLRDSVLARAAADSAFFATGQREDRWQFDLPGYCAARLRAAGVGHILVTGIDTLVEEENSSVTADARLPKGRPPKARAPRRGRSGIRSRLSGWRDRTAGETPNETPSGARRHLLQAAE